MLLATFAGYHLVMGSGQLVFVRYALPLLVMGAILAGGAVLGWGGLGVMLCCWWGN